MTQNLDLLKVTSLKIENHSLIGLFWSVKSEAASFCLFISASLIFSLLLFNDKSRKLLEFYFKTSFGFRVW